MLLKSTILAAALQAPAALAWGTLGHDTIALIAQNYISDATKKFCQDILGDTSATYLGSVATWADSYRYTAEGKFSAPYHFIDAEDSPPTTCNVDLQRDCGEAGCVVSAIANYTGRVKDTSLSQTERQKALKFVVHFVGDIHQPLHDEALEVGGNSIPVKFDGKTTNLHHIWDTEIPEKLRGGYSMTDAQTWATNLTTELNSGAYASQKAGWLSSMDINDATSSALSWARDANTYVCSVVLVGGQSAVENQELGGAYYQGSVPDVEVLIARAGYRLAAWLNLIATGDIGLTARANSSANSTAQPLTLLGRGLYNPNSPAKLARRAQLAQGHFC